ncbi:DUF6177 family protein [Actinomadura sp. NPDC047616]|uniref:DUF6177 family protein n=1 Tax=Actinomadura sp. NPDC047616 TaxID=3155914 RepID=UPI0033D012C0
MSRPHPAIDLVTDAAAIVMQKRPVVPLSTWLVDAISVVSEAQMPLQLVTPHTARLTMPLYETLQPPYFRWVVGHPSGFYDGGTGERLRFDGSAFVPEDPPGVADPYAVVPVGVDGAQLMLDFRVRHPAVDNARLGGATELCYEMLIGHRPSGWGTSEPLAQAWNPEHITDLCRGRAPQSTRFFHTGPSGVPAIGVTRVSRNTEGIDEAVTLHLGYGPVQALPLAVLADVVERLVTDHGLVDFQAHARPGRPDLTAVPNDTGTAAPIGMALGSDAVREIGSERAFAPPGITARQLGHARFPGAWYQIGDGDDTNAWTTWRRLFEHLAPGLNNQDAPRPGDRRQQGTSEEQSVSDAPTLEEGVWRRRPPRSG